VATSLSRARPSDAVIVRQAPTIIDAPLLRAAGVAACIVVGVQL
jgi:hypothetical protein